MSVASIALDRFGLGGRADQPAPRDPRGWVSSQLSRYDARPAPIAAAPGTTAAAQIVADFLEERRGARAKVPKADVGSVKAQPEQQEIRRTYALAVRDHYLNCVGARFAAALVTPAPFVERMVHFWANHFAVSADKQQLRALAGPFEFEAIRPHVLGSFRDMLSAVERHPAMLVYLDQTVSIGPDSEFGRRAARRKVGLNENLAREILELHTIGVRTGYSQADVTEFARALTGWTSRGMAPRSGPAEGHAGEFVFIDRLHQPGARTILGTSYAEGGEKQGQAVLDALARNPSTATHLATKLARHFTGDQPPAAMVARIAAAYTRSDGDLPTIYRAIIDSPEAWVDQPLRFRTPWDWSVATLRATGATTIVPMAAVALMQQLGQPVWKPGQPSGYDDIDQSWAGPDAVMRRVEAAERFAGRTSGPVDARKLASVIHPDALSPATAQALGRAESPAQALALLLVAPEAMRR